MKKLLLTLICVIGMITISISQCSLYQIYESFTSTLPTQGGTWAQTSITYNTASLRTGTHNLSFNAAGDIIRTPQISNPGVVSFWFRRSNSSATHGFVVETSPDGTTWTTRNTYSGTMSTTYVQRVVDLTSLGLTNVFIRVRDTRASGTTVWYLDDLSVTSTSASINKLLPILGACSQTLNSTLTYTLSDDGGPAGPMSTGYSNSVNRTITLTPSDNTKKLQLSFSQMDLETSYDYLYIYDGANTSAPLLATLNGTTIPSAITAENASGQLTIRWTTDISNVGAWGGFLATITSVAACTTPTVGGTLASSKTITTVNDATLLTTSGNDGTITKLEWSYDNFTSIAGTISNPANPYTITMNVQQSNIYFRTTSKNGTCPSGVSNIVNVTLKNAPAYSSGVVDGDHITNVTFSDINNTTTNDGDAYSDFTSIIGNVTKGEPYNLSVTATNTLSPGQGYAAWIDWNGDAIFQTSENVLLKPTANSTSQLIIIPSDAVTGDVVMRVLSVWNSTPDIDAYYSLGYGYGEIEEYTIRISDPISLPVELTQFEAVAYPQWNVVKWNTASENNSSHFDLQSSIDGEMWRTITTKLAAGNSTEEIKYSWIDYNKNELIYYKLIQFDIDGKSTEYGPIMVQRGSIDKVIVKYINLMGQEINPLTTTGLVIEVYDDGSIRKVIR